MSKISAVVIDDEFFNRGLITLLISRMASDIEVVAEAEGFREGIRIIQNHAPDVVFLDIKMPDGSGFDLLERFQAFEFEVVFITGFDEYESIADRHNALDYVLKPIDLDKFKHTLDKIRHVVLAKKKGETNN
jgi:two-component system LytT family response regulator